MSKEKVVLGLDTSCYTTSLAVMNLEGKLLHDKRIILSVKEGTCGLAQSEMVFQHTRNLPKLFREIECFENFEIMGIGVTNRPRPLADSYMPAFLAGFGLAESLGKVLSARVYSLSHQENHMEAGLWSSKGPNSGHFLLLHASGGTTDLLLAKKMNETQYNLTPCGGSIDLHAGQFVDRVGVALGLPFPTGVHLEGLAKKSMECYELPIAVRKNAISFSGPCSAALRIIENGARKSDMARAVEIAIGETFNRAIRNVCSTEDITEVLLVGGVSSNKFIRDLLIEKLKKRNIEVFIPESKYSGDNAVGSAAYALHMVRKDNDIR